MGFCDPSTKDAHPGWPLRNLLAFCAAHKKYFGDSVKILCWRNRYQKGIVDCSHSLMLEISINEVDDVASAQCSKVIGWELNNKDSLGPRFVDMSRSLDPSKQVKN